MDREIDDAITYATDTGTRKKKSVWSEPETEQRSEARREAFIAGLRRFFEGLDDGLTVAEIRRELEGS